MPKHQYINPTGVLFDDETDPDEYNPNGFRSRIPRPMPKKTIISNGNLTKQEQQKQLLMQKKREIEKNTIESAMRSLQLLHETQEIGIHTARELNCQGEKLQKTNTRLDEIDSHLKQSRKDMDGIKNVFYGFKNIISGKSHSPSPSHHDKKRKAHKKSPKIGKSKFYETMDHSFHGSSKFAEFETTSKSTSLPSLYVESVCPAEPPRSQQVDDILEAHLEDITNHIEQLAHLGAEFGKEIDNQNELIDTLQDKVERADINIGKQNKDMNKILGK